MFMALGFMIFIFLLGIPIINFYQKFSLFFNFFLSLKNNNKNNSITINSVKLHVKSVTVWRIYDYYYFINSNTEQKEGNNLPKVTQLTNDRTKI